MTATYCFPLGAEYVMVLTEMLPTSVVCQSSFPLSASKRFEFLIHITVEKSIRLPSQYRAVARSTADIKSKDPAGFEIDFREAGQFIRIRHLGEE
jgi:hypothetical protein